MLASATVPGALSARVGAAVVLAALTTAACSADPAPAGRTAGSRTSVASSAAGNRTSSAAPAASSTAPTSPSLTTPSGTTPSPAPDPAQQKLAGMSLEQRVGQLFMVGASDTGVDQSAVQTITDNAVGSVILTGSSFLSVSATAAITAQLQRTAPPGVGLIVATDQEGGQVQRLRGPGFPQIPSALAQSREPVPILRADTARWAAALRQAGVNLDLAPVADTVPPGISNPPIGGLDRQYGSTVSDAEQNVAAVVQGLTDAGVQATVKHFPGLGRVTANTDYAGGVVDSVTVPGDPYLQPFAAGIRAGARFVMMSTAVYRRIDPTEPAAFSPAVIGSMLRHNLGFQGVVISDDLGLAEQVAYLAPADRAVAFLGAGGDIVLTVVPGQIPAMTAAVVARARSDPNFAALVDAAALRVLETKARMGLLR